MMKKPNLDHAEVIRKTIIPESILRSLSPALIAHLEKEGVKEIVTEKWQ